MSSKKLIYLQYLRGISALLVVNFHCRFWIGEDSGRFLFGNGSIGVLFFFCLSGFIISHTLRKEKSPLKDFTNFMLKRFSRIWPLYFLCTLLTFLIFKHILLTSPSLFQLITSILFIPTIDLPVLHVGWSINAEMIYYFTWGGVFFFAKKKYLNIVGAILCLSFLLLLLLKMEGPNILLRGYHFYFFAGVLLGLNLEWLKKIFSLSSIKAGIILLVLSVPFVLFYFDIIKTYELIFPILVPITILLITSINNPKKRNFLGRFFEKTGDISYSLYLIHPIVIYLAPEILFYLELESIVKSKLGWLLINVLTYLISLLTFHGIELTFYKRLAFNKK